MLGFGAKISWLTQAQDVMSLKEEVIVGAPASVVLILLERLKR